MERKRLRNWGKDTEKLRERDREIERKRQRKRITRKRIKRKRQRIKRKRQRIKRKRNWEKEIERGIERKHRGLIVGMHLFYLFINYERYY